MLNNGATNLRQKNQKWRRPGDLKMEIDGNKTQFLYTEKIFSTFSNKFWNLVIISNNLASICRKSGVSL